MFKLTVATISIVLSVLFNYRAPITERPVTSPTEMREVTIVGEVPQASAPIVFSTHEVTVTGQVMRRQTPSKAWMCGHTYVNLVGGETRNCEWK